MNNNYRQIVKWLLYLLVYAVLVVFQTNVLPHMRLFGVHPNLLPVAAAMVAVLEGGVPGAVFGLFAGLCCDALYARFEVIHMIWFFLSGLLIGRMAAAFFKKNFVTAALCSVVSLAVLNFLLMLLFFLIPGRAGFASLTQVALPEIAFSALFTPLVYWPLRAVNKRWVVSEEEG